MSPTNIHNPVTLLSRAGIDGTLADQAMIMPFNEPVLIVSGPLSQDDIDQYRWCLKSPHVGSWIRKDAVSVSAASTGAITPADDRLEIPQIRVSPGLSQKLRPGDQTRYVLVIQGRSGAKKVKVMVG